MEPGFCARQRAQPARQRKFRLRMPNATHKAFLVSTRAMLADGVAKALAPWSAAPGRGPQRRPSRVG